MQKSKSRINYWRRKQALHWKRLKVVQHQQRKNARLQTMGSNFRLKRSQSIYYTIYQKKLPEEDKKD